MTDLRLKPPEGLHAEIIELYSNLGERTGTELLAELNSPHRIQQRGFPVRSDHLLAVIVDRWRFNDNTRFCLYDYDMAELASTRVYQLSEKREAHEDADQFDNVILLRFQI